MDKMIRDKTVKVKNMGKDKDGNDRIVAEDRTFFCSELVAKAFKILGVLVDDEKACSNYFPGNFSAKKAKTLNLTKGTTIDYE